jgi:hypothetical protein
MKKSPNHDRSGERPRVSGVCEDLTQSPGADVRQSSGDQHERNAHKEVSVIAASDLDECTLRRVTFTHTKPIDHFLPLAFHRHSEPLAHGDERRVGKIAKLIDLHARLTFRPAWRMLPSVIGGPAGCLGSFCERAGLRVAAGVSGHDFGRHR